MKQLFLVRHAEALYTPDVSDAERPLTPRGLRQAAELAARLHGLGIEEVHTSPYQRCRHTIAPLSGRLGLEPEVVHDLRERAFTDRRVEDWASTWRTAWMDPDFAFEDGESGRAAQARMYDAVVAVALNSNARTLALSSHGNVIALLLQRIDASFDFGHACAIRNPDVFRVTFDGRRLSWDSAFALPELGAFATTFGSDPDD